MLNKNLILRRICPSTSKDEVRRIWKEIQAEARHSFFTSWGWIETWLDTLSNTGGMSVLVGELSGKAVLCCVLIERESRRFALVRKNIAHINATGDPIKDELTIEYNGMLVIQTQTDVNAVFSGNILSTIDEFSIPGMSDARLLNQYFDRSFFVRVDARAPCHYVDLSTFRRTQQEYLQSLSTNTRGQIRRSLRRLEELGEIQVRAAQDVAEALRFLDELTELHQLEWASRGQAGAFATEYFVEFHRNLIRRRFADGEIQVLRVTAGKQIVGYLYNFVYDHEVLFYQSGFNYGEFRKEKPGMVSHYLAIQHALHLGFERYNFLAGDAQYKRSLGTGKEDLFWVIATRKSPSSRAEYALRYLRRKLDYNRKSSSR